jgi:repressor of nif and glnA expression
MSSANSEIQRDELDALSSILDEDAFELNQELETTHGTVVIEVILPDEFSIEYHLSIINRYFIIKFLYNYIE